MADGSKSASPAPAPLKGAPVLLPGLRGPPRPHGNRPPRPPAFRGHRGPTPETKRTSLAKEL